jgi:YidC/Oxa1 family membrane protein insertase
MPLTFKQLNSSAKMQELQPKIKELQEKYKNDKQMLNQELFKFYKDNNYSPFSGCLPILVQFPILISLYWVVMKPLQYMFGKSPDTINKIVKVINGFADKKDKIDGAAMDAQIKIMNFLSENLDKLSDSKLSKYITENDLVNVHFPSESFGINLSYKPSLDTKNLFGADAGMYWGLLIIPVMAVILTFVSSKYSMKRNMSGNIDKGNNGKKDQTTQMMGMMVYFAPLMTAIFAFNFPVGLALYWSVGSAFQIVQQFIINKYKSAKKEVLINK